MGGNIADIDELLRAKGRICRWCAADADLQRCNRLDLGEVGFANRRITSHRRRHFEDEDRLELVVLESVKDQGGLHNRQEPPHPGGRSSDLERRDLSGPVQGSRRSPIIVKRACRIVAGCIGSECIGTPGRIAGIHEIHRPHIIKNLRQDLIAIRRVLGFKRPAKTRNRLGAGCHFLEKLVHLLVLGGTFVVLLITLGILTGQVIPHVVCFVSTGVLRNCGGKSKKFVKGRALLVIVVYRPDGDARTTKEVQFRRPAIGGEEKPHLFQGTWCNCRIGPRIEHGASVQAPGGALGRKHQFVHRGIKMLGRDFQYGDGRGEKLIGVFCRSFSRAIPIRHKGKNLVNRLLERPVCLVAIRHDAVVRRYSPKPP